MHYAAAKGHIDCVRILLDYGAEPYLQNALGDTPIDLAQEVAQPSTKRQ